MKTNDKAMAHEEKMPFPQSLRSYWWGLWLAAFTPTTVVLAGEYIRIPGIVPVLFFGMMLTATVIPYRLGKAPYAYVITCCLVFFFLGSAIAFGTMYALGIDGTSRTISP